MRFNLKTLLFISFVSFLLFLSSAFLVGCVSQASKYNKQGIELYRNKQYDQAIEVFSTAIDLNHEYKDAYINRGLVYKRLQQYEMAIADFTQVIRIDPNSDSAYLSRSECYDCVRKYDLSALDVDKAIELNPSKFTYGDSNNFQTYDIKRAQKGTPFSIV